MIENGVISLYSVTTNNEILFINTLILLLTHLLAYVLLSCLVRSLGQMESPSCVFWRKG